MTRVRLHPLLLNGLLAIVTVAASTTAVSAPQGLVLADAERFAALLDPSGLPSAAQLQAAYLDPGSPGVRIFTPHRIRDASTLAAAIAADPQAYRRAVHLCLPVARQLQAEATRIGARIGALLGATWEAPVYVVFGAGNSGGTADAQGLVLGLEVICREAKDRQDAEQLLRGFVAHELVHVHQERVGTEQSTGDLLRQSLVEGFADYVMTLTTGGTSGAEGERRQHGQSNEAALWREFRATMVTAAGDAGLAGWLYSPSGVPGRPPDMGYWIGMRICEAFVARSVDRAQALQTLLQLRDPRRILDESGYGRDW